MRTSLRTLLPLTLVVAAPWLGLVGGARAGYLAPASLVSRAPATSFSDGLVQIDSAAGASAAVSDEPNDPIDQASDGGRPQRTLDMIAVADFGANSSSPGAGSPAPSPDTGSGSTGPLPGAVKRPEMDAPTLTGVLFIESAGRRPPPFPSRLFRPPRW